MKKKYKNGIAKLGRQQYEVLVTRRDPRAGGRRISRRRAVKGSRYEAEAAKRELEAELEAELSGKARAKLTLGDYARQWLKARSASLKPSTREKYVNDLERHILPALGCMQLADLRPRHVTTFLARKQGAPRTKRNWLGILQNMAKDAIAEELIDRDFCLRVSIKIPPHYTEDQPNMLAPRQLEAVLACVPARWLDLVRTLAYTGLRWGEATGLHWSDVDLEQGEVTIKWNNWKGILVRPKSDKGYRTIPLARQLQDVLRARRQRMETDNHPGLRNDLVFPTHEGTLHKAWPLSAVLRDACKDAGVKIRFTPHGFRRTWNNIARRRAGGVVVRAMIGHASEAMTDHYSLVDREEKRAAAEDVAACLSGSKGDDRSQVPDEPQAASESGASDPDATGGSPVDKTVDDGPAPPSPTDQEPE